MEQGCALITQLSNDLAMNENRVLPHKLTDNILSKDMVLDSKKEIRKKVLHGGHCSTIHTRIARDKNPGGHRTRLR